MEPHWEPLGKNLKVLVDGCHRFNTDTLLLADFSLPRQGEFCADFGTGCGAIPLLWRSRAKPRKVLAVELQTAAVELAERSAMENGFLGEIQVIPGDLRDYKALLPHQKLDLAACNPPYYPLGSGYLGQDPQRNTARHEGEFSLADLAKAAQYSLKYGGRLCVCLPSRRLAEAIEVFRQSRLEPKRLRLVQQNLSKPPYLFLLECRSGGKPGLTVEPVLLLRGQDGGFSPEMARIYGDYLELAHTNHMQAPL